MILPRVRGLLTFGDLVCFEARTKTLKILVALSKHDINVTHDRKVGAWSAKELSKVSHGSRNYRRTIFIPSISKHKIMLESGTGWLYWKEDFQLRSQEDDYEISRYHSSPSNYGMRVANARFRSRRYMAMQSWLTEEGWLYQSTAATRPVSTREPSSESSDTTVRMA